MTSLSPAFISSQIRERIRTQRARSLDRRDHDRAMSDPWIRDEHRTQRVRETAAGHDDCPFCR